MLGISSFYHDSAACLIRDGEVIAAAQEERFSRLKHDSKFPSHAIEYCLREAGISIGEINTVVFYEKPFLKFERLLETYLCFAPRGFTSFRRAIPLWIKQKLFQKSLLKKELAKLGRFTGELKFSSHHYSHAASAFFPSPFQEAAVLCMDGVGEWATTSLWKARDNKLELMEEIHFPHSLGLLYSAFTYYIGFKVNSGEYKLMGLAPYGEDKYSQIIKNRLIKIYPDGTFQLNMNYFEFATGLRMINESFENLFGQKARPPEGEITQFHMDIARSIQVVTEDILILLAKDIKARLGISNLCLAGGVALNCVANGKIIENKIFDQVWIQPAAGDAGGALGAALGYWYQGLDNPRLAKKDDDMKGSFLGPSYSNDDIEVEIINAGLASTRIRTTRELQQKIAKLLAGGKIGGLLQGRMEFGPRSLGCRSIIADPRSIEMQSKLNLKIKYRESFRPFAPAVLAEKSTDWFEQSETSPYMLSVCKINKEHLSQLPEDYSSLFGIEKLNIARSKLPAVTHLDLSARLQTVHKETNPFFHELICEFEKITDTPVLVNTSFNIRGEPIVNSPSDAIRCFLNTEMDFLVLENFLILKEEQPANLVFDKIPIIELD
ncbi:MAG: hypothetical protein CME71_02275 [Halobacteriovorax sp.]|nr:hypothetical protein [Halobacteriovorax sp.]